VNTGTMGVNNLPKTVTRQRRRDCDLNPGPSARESSTLTTRLPSHLCGQCQPIKVKVAVASIAGAPTSSPCHLPLKRGDAAGPCIDQPIQHNCSAHCPTYLPARTHPDTPLYDPTAGPGCPYQPHPGCLSANLMVQRQRSMSP